MELRNFNPDTLPWVDSESFEEDLNRRLQTQVLSESDAQALRSWRRDGFLHLPQVVDETLIDRLLRDYRRAWKSRCGLYALVQELGVVPLSMVPERQSLTHRHYRLLDIHDRSEAAREIMLHPEVIRLLSLLLGQPPVAMQSIFFEYPSEQRGHQDFAYVQAGSLSHLVGCWVACEDVDEDNGPLFYYSGSHRITKYDWGDGRLTYDGEGHEAVARFESYLEEACRAAHCHRLTFQAKKGDVLLWHAALVHGGSPANDPQRTRQSFIVHYSTPEAYPRDQRVRQIPPRVVSRNGGSLYELPPLASWWLALKTGVRARFERRGR